MSFEQINNDYGLIDKVAIVTGAGGPAVLDDAVSNGQAAAILLARAGAKVCVVGRNEEAAQSTVDIIKSEGGDGFAHAADVGTEEGCQGVVEACMDLYGRVDCLDNNVATGALGSVLEIELETWREVFEVNVHGMMLMCKYAIAAMIKGGEGGSIVNIGSLSAIRPAGVTSYTVSKGAAMALTTSLAYDHGPDGIRANCIILGPVYTPRVASRMKPEVRDARRDASLLRREGTGWDSAQLVRFLCSKQSNWMTGQSICLDGGASIVGPSRSAV